MELVSCQPAMKDYMRLFEANYHMKGIACVKTSKFCTETGVKMYSECDKFNKISSIET